MWRDRLNRRFTGGRARPAGCRRATDAERLGPPRRDSDDSDLRLRAPRAHPGRRSPLDSAPRGPRLRTRERGRGREGERGRERAPRGPSRTACPTPRDPIPSPRLRPPFNASDRPFARTANRAPPAHGRLGWLRRRSRSRAGPSRAGRLVPTRGHSGPVDSMTRQHGPRSPRSSARWKLRWTGDI